MQQVQLDSDVERLSESLGQLPEPLAEPAFVVVSGLPGTGKTYFCKKLAERMPTVVLESDALRKALFPVPDYSKEESARLFQAVHHLIEKLLKKGIPIILDATNLSEHYREYLYNISERLKAKLILVRIKAPPHVVKERLDTRSRGEASSDADWAVYQKMKHTAQKIGRRHYVADTSLDITPVLDKIVREVQR